MTIICNPTKILLIFVISGFLIFTEKIRAEADTETASAINDLTTTTVVLINMLTSTTSAGLAGISGKFEELTSTTEVGFTVLTATTQAGFEVLTSTTEVGFAVLTATTQAGFEELTSTTAAGFTALTSTTEVGFAVLTATTQAGFEELTSTTAAGFTALTSTTSPAFIGISGKFEELTSTTAAGFRGLSTGLSDLSPATISGYNNMLGSTKVHAFLGFNKAEEDKGEEDKGIEYYILYDKVAEEIDATRIQSLEHDDYFEIVVNNRLVLDISWRADNSRVARVWHMDIGTMNNEIENFYPKLTYLVGGETLAKDTKLSEIEPKYMIDEMLAVKEGVFKVDCPPEVDYVQKRFKVIGSFSVFCKYPTLASVLAKGIASGIVTLSDFDCNNAEDMDGVRVFVPTIKKGEVTTEQFKMQLKRNDAVLRGVIKTFERGQQIDPNFGRYSLLKAEPEASDDVNFFDTDPSLPFLKRMQLLFKFLKRSIATWSIDTETPIEL